MKIGIWETITHTHTHTGKPPRRNDHMLGLQLEATKKREKIRQMLLPCLTWRSLSLCLKIKHQLLMLVLGSPIWPKFNVQLKCPFINEFIQMLTINWTIHLLSSLCLRPAYPSRYSCSMSLDTPDTYLFIYVVCSEWNCLAHGR